MTLLSYLLLFLWVGHSTFREVVTKFGFFLIIATGVQQDPVELTVRDDVVQRQNLVAVGMPQVVGNQSKLGLVVLLETPLLALGCVGTRQGIHL